MSTSFVVSARKFRPSNFQGLLGQEVVSQTLSNAILQGKIAHAYLFCGPRGVGKTSAARIFAKAVNCENLTPQGEACEQCESCLAINGQRSFNIYELDAASHNSADDIRKINEEVYTPPQYGRYKVYIIDEVHMLSTAAFNAFLKTLEEPPEYVIFILATTEKNKVLPTILSRCQVFDFKPIPPQTIVEQLRRVAESEGIEYEQRALDLIARVADGGMRDALSIFDRIVSSSGGHITYQRALSGLNILDDEYYFMLTNHLGKGDYSSALLLLDELLGNGINGRIVVSGLADFLRNLLVARTPATHKLFKYTGSDAERFAHLAGQLSPVFLYKAIDRLVVCERNYRSSNSKRLLIELTLMGIAEVAGAFAPTRTQGASVTPPSSSIGVSASAPVASQGAGVTAIEKKPVPPSTPISQPTARVPASDSAQTLSSTKVAPATGSPSVESAPQVVEPKVQNEVRPAAKPRGGVRLTKISSILNPRQEENESQEEAEETALDSSDCKPLDQEALQIEWMRYAREQLPTQVFLRETMQSCFPVVVSEQEFKVTLLNDLQKQALEEQQEDLLRFLQNELSNAFLKMHVEVSEQPQDSRPITVGERVEYLIKENPATETLIQKLSLTVL